MDNEINIGLRICELWISQSPDFAIPSHLAVFPGSISFNALITLFFSSGNDWEKSLSSDFHDRLDEVQSVHQQFQPSPHPFSRPNGRGPGGDSGKGTNAPDD